MLFKMGKQTNYKQQDRSKSVKIQIIKAGKVYTRMQYPHLTNHCHRLYYHI